MEVAAGVKVHIGHEVMRRMEEAKSQDEDSTTTIRRHASAFLQTRVKSTNGKYVATLNDWYPEVRPIAQKLNTTNCNHEFREEHSARLLQCMPAELMTLVTAGEVAFGSINPDDHAAPATHPAAYKVHWNKKTDAAYKR